MTGLIVALVFLYIWAGIAVCCEAGEDMHPKEKSISYPIIMVLWWAIPLKRGYDKLRGNE